MSKVALTDAKVRGYVATGKPYDIGDTYCRGLQLRVSAKGTRSWSWVGRGASGAVQRKTLGKYPAMGLAAARSAADQARGQCADPTLSSQTPTGTVNELIDGYLAHLAARHKRSADQDAKHLKRLRLAWGDQPVAVLTTPALINHFDQLAGEGKNRSANLLKSVAVGLFRYATPRGLVGSNPLDSYTERPGGAMRPRDRVLASNEVKALWTRLGGSEPGMSKTGALCLKMILLTAQRPGECAGAQIEHFDFAAGLWRLPATATKNKRSHTLPLGDRALELVKEAAGKRSSGPLFPAPRKGAGDSINPNSLAVAVWQWFGKGGEKGGRAPNGLARFTPHDLRRTAATGMRAHGAAVSDISAYLNHTEQGVTAQVYALSERLPEKLRAKQCLEDYLGSLQLSAFGP